MSASRTGVDATTQRIASLAKAAADNGEFSIDAEIGGIRVTIHTPDAAALRQLIHGKPEEPQDLCIP